MNPTNERRNHPTLAAHCDDEARLALLQAAYLHAGLQLAQARLAALADYRCSFTCVEQLAA